MTDFTTPTGGWRITDTVHHDRRNIFDLSVPGQEYHVGTLVSGSRSKIERFQRAGDLMVTAAGACAHINPSDPLAVAMALPDAPVVVGDCLRLIEDMSRSVGNIALNDYQLLNEAPIRARAFRAALAASKETG